MSGSGAASRSPGSPDRRARKGRVRIEVVDLGEFRVTRQTRLFGRRPPAIAAPPRCEDTHVGCIVSGRLHVELEGGEELDLRGGDVFVIPPGHSDWAAGARPCVPTQIVEGELDTWRLDTAVRPDRAA